MIVKSFFSNEWLDRYNGELQPLIDEHIRTYTGVEAFDDVPGLPKPSACKGWPPGRHPSSMP